MLMRMTNELREKKFFIPLRSGINQNHLILLRKKISLNLLSVLFL